MTYPKVINWIYKQDKKSEHIEVYYAEDEATENGFYYEFETVNLARKWNEILKEKWELYKSSKIEEWKIVLKLLSLVIKEFYVKSI